MNPWLALGIFSAMIFGVCVAIILLSRFVGPHRDAPEKLDPYECGVPLLDNTRHRFSVKFYVLAILFILFDIEIVFLVPWALAAKGWPAFAEMVVFVGVLGFGLAYAWKRGSLEWD